MFGYTESAYDVVDKFESSKEEAGDFKKFFEIRKICQSSDESGRFAEIIKRHKAMGIASPSDEGSLYIAIYGKSIDGKENIDVLLKYNKNKKNDLEKDWETLKDSPHAKIKDLLCHRWIEHHHMGYCKDGSVTMY